MIATLILQEDPFLSRYSFITYGSSHTLSLVVLIIATCLFPRAPAINNQCMSPRYYTASLCGAVFMSTLIGMWIGGDAKIYFYLSTSIIIAVMVIGGFIGYGWDLGWKLLEEEASISLNKV